LGPPPPPEGSLSGPPPPPGLNGLYGGNPGISLPLTSVHFSTSGAPNIISNGANPELATLYEVNTSMSLVYSLLYRYTSI
jgi:hypothetical protein